MANNRIYLRCRGCGDVLYMGKSFLEGFYYVSYDGVSLERKLNDFYEKHNYCDNPRAEQPLPYNEKVLPIPDDCGGMDGCFDIVYEDGLFGAGLPDPPKED